MNVSHHHGANSSNNAELGRRYKLGEDGSPASFKSITVTSRLDSLVDPQANTQRNTTNTFTNQTMLVSEGLCANPFNLTSDNYTDIQVLCSGQGGGDLANSTDPFVKCALVYGAARRADGVETLIFKPGDVYQQSVYSCASTIRASIKSVGFNFNATLGNTVKALSVTDLKDKTYGNDDSSNPPPPWGIETVDRRLSSMTQLWGLINSSEAHRENLTTFRAPHMHLPGFTHSAGPSDLPGYQYIPGTTAIAEALGGLYDIGATSSSLSMDDYSGAKNLAMFQKWQELSKNTTSIARLLGIAGADNAANLLTGTRGWGTGRVTGTSGGNTATTMTRRGHRRRDTDPNAATTPVMVPVRLYQKKIQYNWIYGIPALAVALLFGIAFLASCWSLVCRGGPTRIRHCLDHLSAGRLLVERQQSEEIVDQHMPTRRWVESAGARPVVLCEDKSRLNAGSGGSSSPVRASGHEVEQAEVRKRDTEHGRSISLSTFFGGANEPSRPLSADKAGVYQHVRTRDDGVEDAECARSGRAQEGSWLFDRPVAER